MTYGQHAQLERVKRRMTQTALTEAAKVHPNVLRWIEWDRGYGNLPSLLAITHVLGIGINDYFGIAPSRGVWRTRTGSIGEHARSVREEKGFSMRQFSALTGLSVNTIYRLEYDKSMTHTSVILIASKALGISPDEYIGTPSPDWLRRNRE